MKSKLIAISVNILIFLTISCNLNGQGYNISLKIKGQENQEINLGYYYEDKQYIVQTITLDKKGFGEFSGKEKLSGGIYFVITSKNSFFDIIVSGNQNFSISVDTVDILHTIKFKNSKENDLFYQFQRTKSEAVKKVFELEEIKRKMDTPDDVLNVDAQIIQIDSTLEHDTRELIRKNPDLLFSKLLLAMNSLQNPEKIYEYVDFSDSSLIRTPFFYRVLRTQIGINIDKAPYYIISENDKFLEKAKANPLIFRYSCSYFLNFYRTYCKFGINDVFIHLAEKYFLNGKASWIDTTFSGIIKKQTEIFKSSNQGHKAYNFEIQTISGDSIDLYDIKSNGILVFFWSTGCGHCETAAKSLKEYYAELKKRNIEIIGICIDANSLERVTQIVQEWDLPWINGFDSNINNRYREYYYVCSTPIVYFLDNRYIIVNKVAGEDNIKTFSENILRLFGN